MANQTQYLPFARKYRPNNFSKLLGQEILVKILSYAITHDRLANSYLLTGIRGVGKTSSARLIAKTVNCQQRKIQDNLVVPCEICENCLNFNKQQHPDIIEMDAASKTGVEDVRKIIEASEYKPLLGQKKFFIIDEVHMLSKNAFNALLKIIEEPPTYVIFIFATTETHKIPATIVSRCQRYDLRRLNFSEITTLLQYITKAEKLELSADALKVIAIKSEGSARDAVKLLDQAVSYHYHQGEEGVIDAKLIETMLGIVEFKLIFELSNHIIAGDATASINLLTEIYYKATNLELFLAAIADFFAELAKGKIIKNYTNPLYSHYQADIDHLIKDLSLAKLSLIWQLFQQELTMITRSHNQLIAAQMLLIKVIYACDLPPLDELYQLKDTISASITDDLATDNLAAKKKTVNSAEFNPAPIKQLIADPSQKLEAQPQEIKEEKEEEKEHLKKYAANEESKIPAIYQETNDSEANSFAFLQYCQQHREMSVYYQLFNQVEIIDFSKNILHLAGEIEVNFKKLLTNLLYSWSGENWQLLIQDKKNIISFKEKLTRRAEKLEHYQLIRKNFADAEISDIILEF